MVEGGCRPDAHEFGGTDLDDRHARVIVKVGDDVFRHGESSGKSLWQSSGGTIAGRLRDA
jgi:hypothetical protein